MHRLLLFASCICSGQSIWTIDSTSSINHVTEASADRATPTGLFADINVRVNIPLRDAVSALPGSQWQQQQQRFDTQPMTSAIPRSLCLALAVNLDALRDTNISIVDVLHWSNSTKSVDIQLRYSGVVQGRPGLQLRALIGDRTAEALSVQGQEFRAPLQQPNTVTFLWLTLFIANFADADEHHMAAWQLQPVEHAWTPVFSYTSEAIKAEQFATGQSLILSEAVFTAHNMSLTSLYPDAQMCVTAAISDASMSSTFAANQAALSLTWPQWTIDGVSIFINNKVLKKEHLVWTALSQFTVARTYAFVDRMLTGTRWNVQICVCRPWVCTFDTAQSACTASVTAGVLFVFYNVSGDCLSSTCYFIDHRYAMLAGATQFYGLVAANGAAYGVQTTEFISTLQQTFDESTRNTPASNVHCGAPPAADDRLPPAGLSFNQKAADWLHVLFHTVNGVDDGRRRHGDVT